ncbi:MAG: hypothetical protein ACJ8R9_30655 [Steroidobacteraceae bacterium]
MHREVPRDGEEVLALSHKPGLHYKLNQNADASIQRVAFRLCVPGFVDWRQMCEVSWTDLQAGRISDRTT